jgi:hypothetical protein
VRSLEEIKARERLFKLASRPIPPERTEFPGSRHNLDCKSRLVQEEYDETCFRCQKIKKVIALRRKQVKTGASLLESKSAYELAGRIIDDYELTRGETFDKKYTDIPIPPLPKRKAHEPATAEDFDEMFK